MEKSTQQQRTNLEYLTPFRVEIPQAKLDVLRTRLQHTRLPDPLPGDSWDHGVPVEQLRSLIDRWAQHDWRATETRINQYPQFTTRIDGQTIHVIHVKSVVEGAIPILLTHGWPGSFFEFEGLIGPLTDPEAHGGTVSDAFDVIIPTLPGFGFSTPVETDGWTTQRIAAAWLELMSRLGYERFVAQGGDIGADIAPELGRLAPDRVIAVHVNGALGAFAFETDDETAAQLSPVERDRMRRVETFMEKEFGYIAIQSTRPSLIGAMTADSPAAQLAWIVDKLQAWSHPPDRSAVEALGEEFVFANASLYWFTASVGSAAFVGYAQDEGWGQVAENSGVPTAAIQFAHDIGIRHLAEQANTIVRWTDIEDRGGHFAALEEPNILITDIREFIRPFRT